MEDFSATWDKVFKKPEDYLNHVLISANEQGIPENAMKTFVTLSVGANLVNAKTKKGRAFFSDALRLVV